MLTWNDLLQALINMPPSERDATIKVFDYDTNQFYDGAVCLEGYPPVHITIESDKKE
jgi:hypothetical protein